MVSADCSSGCSGAGDVADDGDISATLSIVVLMCRVGLNGAGGCGNACGCGAGGVGVASAPCEQQYNCVAQPTTH